MAESIAVKRFQLLWSILFESRRHKLQIFLSVLGVKVEQLWFPLFTSWLKANCPDYRVLYLAIDCTSWKLINLLMVSLIWQKRAIRRFCSNRTETYAKAESLTDKKLQCMRLLDCLSSA